jgi:hypothetical protein
MADITIAASGNAPAIAAFRNIQFVAAFTDGSSSTINAMPLSAGGRAAGGTFRVNAPTDVNPTRQWPAIAEFFGGFVIAWIERGPNLGPNVKLRVFDGDTFAPGDEIQVNTTPVDSNQPPALARLSDGGFVLVWADARPEERIRAQRFDRLGNRNGPDFRANTVAGLHRRPMVAVLANGSIVIGWLARVTGPLQVRFQIFDASATPVGGERLLDGGASLASVTALDSGRFVIAHVRHPGDGETVPQVIAEVNVFEPTGAASGSATPVTNEQAIMSSWPTLAPLPGGRFLVAWTQGPMSAGDSEPDVKAKIFSDTQGALGQISRLNSLTDGTRFSVCAATASGVGSGANVLLAWANSNSGSPAVAVFGTAFPDPGAGFP